MAPALAQSSLPSPEKEIPGTGQTIGDLTTAGYSQEEINELLSQEVVPDSGITIADAMREGWSDTDVGNYIATSEPEYPDLLDASMSVEGELQVDNAPKSSFFPPQQRVRSLVRMERRGAAQVRLQLRRVVGRSLAELHQQPHRAAELGRQQAYP